MITAAFLLLLLGVPRLVLGMLPEGPDPQPMVAAVDGSLSGIFSAAASMSAWIPWGQVAAALFVVVGVLAAAGVIKLIRIVASFLTLGGGSAA